MPDTLLLYSAGCAAGDVGYAAGCAAGCVSNDLEVGGEKVLHKEFYLRYSFTVSTLLLTNQPHQQPHSTLLLTATNCSVI